MATEPLSANDVRKVAGLSRLAIDDSQTERYRAELASVLSYMERLKGIDLTGVEPLTQISDAVNRLDDDTPGPTLPNVALMRMAPEAAAPFIKVPKVLDEGGAA